MAHVLRVNDIQVYGMVRWVFSRKNTQNVRLHVSKKEWEGEQSSLR